MPSKVCRKCQVEKPFDEFYTHPRMRDGHLHSCKSCCLSYEKSNRERARHRCRIRSNFRYKTDPVFRQSRINSAMRNNGKFHRDDFAEVQRMRLEEDCFYCGNAGGTVDHLVPKSRCGTSDLSNLVPCCVSCNSSKGTKSLTEFYQQEVT